MCSESFLALMDVRKECDCLSMKPAFVLYFLVCLVCKLHHWLAYAGKAGFNNAMETEHRTRIVQGTEVDCATLSSNHSREFMPIEPKMKVSLLVFRVYKCSEVRPVSTCTRIPLCVEANSSAPGSIL